MGKGDIHQTDKLRKAFLGARIPKYQRAKDAFGVATGFVRQNISTHHCLFSARYSNQFGWDPMGRKVSRPPEKLYPVLFDDIDMNFITRDLGEEGNLYDFLRRNIMQFDGIKGDYRKRR